MPVGLKSYTGEEFGLHSFDILYQYPWRQINRFVSRAQPLRQARSKWSKIYSVRSCFEFLQRQMWHAHPARVFTGGTRVPFSKSTVRSEAQTQIQNSFRPEEASGQSPLHTSGQAFMFHARLQFQEDFPVMPGV